MRIKETSRITITVDGNVMDYSPQSMTDAIERAVNHVLEHGGTVTITERVSISREEG